MHLFGLFLPNGIESLKELEDITFRLSSGETQRSNSSFLQQVFRHFYAYYCYSLLMKLWWRCPKTLSSDNFSTEDHETKCLHHKHNVYYVSDYKQRNTIEQQNITEFGQHKQNISVETKNQILVDFNNYYSGSAGKLNEDVLESLLSNGYSTIKTKDNALNLYSLVHSISLVLLCEQWALKRRLDEVRKLLAMEESRKLLKEAISEKLQKKSKKKEKRRAAKEELDGNDSLALECTRAKTDLQTGSVSCENGQVLETAEPCENGQVSEIGEPCKDGQVLEVDSSKASSCKEIQAFETNSFEVGPFEKDQILERLSVETGPYEGKEVLEAVAHETDLCKEQQTLEAKSSKTAPCEERQVLETTSSKISLCKDNNVLETVSSGITIGEHNKFLETASAETNLAKVVESVNVEAEKSGSQESVESTMFVEDETVDRLLTLEEDLREKLQLYNLQVSFHSGQLNL